MSSNSTVTIRLYRTLLKQCRTLNHICKQQQSIIPSTTTKMTNDNNLILLQAPLNPRDWGHATKYASHKLRPIKNNLDDDDDDDDDDDEICNNILHFLYKNINANNELLTSLLLLKKRKNVEYDVDDDVDYDMDGSNDELTEEDPDDDDEDNAIVVSSNDIYNTIQTLFRSSNNNSNSKDANVNATTIMNQQNIAMNAIRLFNYQLDMLHYTSITLNIEHNIRVIATSRYIGRSPASISNKALLDEDASNNQPKHRFTYRIRIENLNNDLLNDNDDDESNNREEKKQKDKTKEKNTTVQLLGRSWNIIEIIDDEKNDERCAAKVNAPSGGAVGHLPVIRPGEVFEYMSGCDLATISGKMHGNFYMAIVDQKTNSSKLGDANVKAFKLNKNVSSQHEDFFNLNVDSFFLEAR